MIYRNLHHPLSELDILMRDACRLSGTVFKLIYGNDVLRYRAPDNSFRVCTTWKIPAVEPIKKKIGERVDPPRPKDKIVVIEDGEERFGHITYVNSGDDVVGVYMYDTHRPDSFSLDCLETERNGRIRWRIHQ